mgnify:FL=1
MVLDHICHPYNNTMEATKSWVQLAHIYLWKFIDGAKHIVLLARFSIFILNFHM